MNARLLVVRSGERSFPVERATGLEVVERRSHSIETLRPDPVGGSFDLAIFTSRPAADRFLARDDLLSTLPGRVVAVGPATAERFRSGLSVEVEEGGGSVGSLLRKLPPDLSKTRVLLPRGEDADPQLSSELARRGARVVSLVLYRKIPLPYDAALDSAITAPPSIVAFCTTSPAAARWLLDGAGQAARARLTRTIAIALGDATSNALSSLGVSRVEIARPPTFETVARIASELGGRAPAGR
ncbi:MAG TPA: uroporphyrinogen-III synthase [Thermoanaerobaculia bacterium]